MFVLASETVVIIAQLRRGPRRGMAEMLDSRLTKATRPARAQQIFRFTSTDSSMLIDKTAFHFLACISAAALLALTLAACSERSPSPPLSKEEKRLQASQQKARMCTACHGPKGISRVTSYPSLAGKSREYLSQQLHAFRSGTRKNPMMSSIAANLAEEDIALLSHYFSSLPGPASAPQDLQERSSR